MEDLVIIILYVVIFAISIVILRWALRINVIVEQLDDIAMSNHKIIQNQEMILDTLGDKEDSSTRSVSRNKSTDGK